jgi:hypothetical protein
MNVFNAEASVLYSCMVTRNYLVSFLLYQLITNVQFLQKYAPLIRNKRTGASLVVTKYVTVEKPTETQAGIQLGSHVVRALNS